MQQLQPAAVPCKAASTTPRRNTRVLGSVRRTKRNDRIVEMYRGGTPAKAIADELGLSLRYVYQLLRRAGVAVRKSTSEHLATLARERRQSKAARNAELREAYASGATREELAERYDITVQRVRQILALVPVCLVDTTRGKDGRASDGGSV